MCAAARATRRGPTGAPDPPSSSAQRAARPRGRGGPMTGRTLDRLRLERLMAAETAAFERANPRSRALFERAKGSLLDGVPMNWMIRWAGPFPLFVDEADGRPVPRRRRPRVRRLLPRRHRGDGRPRAFADDRRRRAPAPPRDHPHAAHRGRDRRRRRAPPPVRAPVLAVHAHGDRRQPVRDPARPPHHRPVEDPRPQPQLPRLGRRDVRLDRARRRRRRPARQPRRARAAVARRRGSSRSTTSTRSTASSPTATSPSR